MNIAVRKSAIAVGMMIFSALIMAESITASEFCKWTDENGVVHYGEDCPGNVDSKIVTAKGERTESQVRAGQELSDSLLSAPTQSNNPVTGSEGLESKTDTRVPAQPGTRGSQDPESMSVQELEALCEEARERRLAPEREQLIQDCVTNKRKSQEYCERFYSTHGDAHRTASGVMRSPLYMDLPECVAAFEAKKKGK